jgi:hypothetical protein
MSKQQAKAAEPKEEVKPAEKSDSIQSHSAQVTEGEAAQARAEGVDLKEKPLDPQDGARLDQNKEAAEFDEDAEEEAANADPEEQPEPVKNAVINPNGLGSEWPRG